MNYRSLTASLILTGLLGLAFATRPAWAGESANRLENGDFETGQGNQAAGWSKFDGLIEFWDKAGKPGHCLRLDTSVLKVDKANFQKNAEAAKQRSRGSEYDTVGAHEGAWIFSLPITLQPDDQYFILEADVMGPDRSSAFCYPQVLVRGYKKFDSAAEPGTSSFFQTPHEGGPAYSEQFGKATRPAQEGDYLMVYRNGLVCRQEEGGKWQHYKLGLKLPKMAKFRPEVLLIKPYAMWPLGNYYFDNIVFRRVDKAAYDAAAKEGHSAKGFMPGE